MPKPQPEPINPPTIAQLTRLFHDFEEQVKHHKRHRFASAAEPSALEVLQSIRAAKRELHAKLTEMGLAEHIDWTISS